MNKLWAPIAHRVVQGLGVQPGELILVRDDTGNLAVLLETMLAIERVGATPLPQLTPADYMQRLWTEAPQDYLAQWDQHRGTLMHQIDRIVVLAGARPDFDQIPQEAFNTWQKAEHRLSTIEEERRLPYLLVAIPTEQRAQQLGLSLESLEAMLLPALGASIEELQREISQVLKIAQDGQMITIRSGDGHELRMVHGNRRWLSDDGYIDATDQSQGAIVSNLPAGSIYTTVLEDQTEGSLWLPRAGQATDVVLYFNGARITRIEASSGAEALTAELDSHSGEPRRVGHIGLGLNPYLDRPIGWTLVDEHVHGHVFISLGENRYMGGQNESSLNVDYALADATLLVDNKVIVSNGNVVVDSEM